MFASFLPGASHSRQRQSTWRLQLSHTGECPRVISHCFIVTHSLSHNLFILRPCRLFLVSREGKLVDMSGGADAAAPASARDLAKVSTSVGWWGASTMGLCDGAAGRLALAQIPGFSNVLGATAAPTKIVSGTSQRSTFSSPPRDMCAPFDHSSG